MKNNKTESYTMAEQNDKIVLSGYQKRNLKENLMAATKEEIITTAGLVGANFKKSAKKEAIAYAAVDTIFC